MKNLNSYPWDEVYENFNYKGYVILEKAIAESECVSIANGYDNHDQFRKTINMARYRFGSGEYRYYNYPLPSIVQSMREQIYDKLVPLANTWMNVLKTGIQYPESHDQFIAQCANHDQLRPTPLLLKYTSGDFNTMHQDLYGDIYFPLQVILSLSKKDEDYSGGELVLTEQIPRAQSKAMVITPNQGDLVILSTQFRPKKGSRGYFRVNMKHGVSEIRTGLRQTLGIIFHDSK